MRLLGVAIDVHGLSAEALDAAFRQSGAKTLYVVPTLHNPTNSVMPAERRAAIAAVCRRRDATIVEDDIYSFLVPDAPPPLAAFAPERTVLVSSLSKCLAPGLRIGFARAPRSMLDRIAAAQRSTVWMASPLLAEIAARLIESGAAARLADWQRGEAARRQAVAGEILAGADFAAHPNAFHIWLRLPAPWRREAFAAAARRRGVGVAPADAFAVGRASAPHAVRVSLSAARDESELRRALEILAVLLAGRPETESEGV